MFATDELSSLIAGVNLGEADVGNTEGEITAHPLLDPTTETYEGCDVDEVRRTVADRLPARAVEGFPEEPADRRQERTLILNVVLTGLAVAAEGGLPTAAPTGPSASDAND